MTPTHSDPRFESDLIRWSWQKIVLLLLLLFVVAAGFTTMNVGFSRKTGRLSTTTSYDDAVYLNIASKFYFEARRGKSSEAARSFFTTYTHAPGIVTVALLGFFAFGFSYIKVYYALAIVVFIYLGFVALIGRRLPAFYLGCLLLASLAFPMVTMAALEFRPDLLWAIVLGGSCVWFLGSPNAFVSWRNSLFFGLALGGALLAKPSTFAMTLLVFGGSWFLAACIAFVSGRTDFKKITIGLALTFGAAFLTCAWYWIPQAKNVFSYFYSNSFGGDKDIWGFNGTLWESLFYYVRGVPLQSNLGLLLFPLLGLYIFGALYDIVRSGKRENQIRGGAFLWMLGCLFVINGLFTIKSPFLGGSFYAFLIFGALWYLARLLRWSWILDREREPILRWRLGGLTALSLFGVAWWGYQYPKVCIVNEKIAAGHKAINRALAASLLAKASGKVDLMLTQGSPVIAEFLEMEFRRRRKAIEIQNLAMARTLDQFLETSKRMNFVALQDLAIQGSPGYPFPSEKFQPELMTYFRKSPEWSEVAHYPGSDGKKVYLFERVAR